MLEVVSALLRIWRGDASLTVDFETTLLKACDGRVSITGEDPDFWTASRKAWFEGRGFSAGREPFAG